MTAPEWDAMVVVGRIVRPHGHRGNVVVHPETDFGEERFAPGSRMFLLRDGRPVEMEVVGSREHDGRWVVGLSGVATMNDAEDLRGCELRIPEAAMRPAGDGRYYVHDLVGCRVRTAAGQEVGRIARVELATGIPLLEIDAPGGEVLVPFSAAICTRVDLGERVVTIEPPEGLLDLNVTRKAR